MKKYTLPFAEFKSVIPFVRFHTHDGKDICALIDSGSESTMIDKDFKKEYSGIIQSSELKGKMNAVGIGGKETIVLLEAKAKVPMVSDKGEEGALEFKGYVHDLSKINSQLAEIYGVPWKVSLLLGSDTLRDLHSTINYAKKEICFRMPETAKIKKTTEVFDQL